MTAEVRTTENRLTVKQAAERLGVSPSLVYQWCNERRLAHLRLGRDGKRGKILIDEKDVDEFIASARVEAGKGTGPIPAPLRHITRR